MLRETGTERLQQSIVGSRRAREKATNAPQLLLRPYWRNRQPRPRHDDQLAAAQVIHVCQTPQSAQRPAEADRSVDGAITHEVIRQLPSGCCCVP